MTHDLSLGKSIVAKGEAARDMEGIELENIKCVTCLLARQMDLYFNFATVFGENQAAKGVAELSTRGPKRVLAWHWEEILHMSKCIDWGTRTWLTLWSSTSATCPWLNLERLGRLG